MDFPPAPKNSAPCFCARNYERQAYREIEYGHEAISPDMLKKFIEKYDLKRKHLTTAPDFASLLDHPTRKLIEYQRVAMSSTQRKHLMHFLRDFLPRTY